MSKITAKIKLVEEQIERGLWDLEINEQIDQALQVYREAEAELLGLNLGADHPAYRELQRVLSYCLMRQGNLLRQIGQPKEAMKLGEREILAANASGDEITLARSLMSNGTNLIVMEEIETGLKRLEDARRLLEKGDSIDHMQGLGWYWVLRADLANVGMLKAEPAEVIEITTQALDILLPIENWPGVARLYAARAKAHEKLRELEEAAKDRLEQEKYERKTKPGAAST